MLYLRTIIVGLAMLSTAPTFADPAPSVQSLLKQHFDVVGSVSSAIGPGLFLRKNNELFLCFVAETPQSKTVTTQYCKPVE